MSASELPVVNKTTQLDLVHTLDLSSQLLPGETLISCLVEAVQPITSPSLSVTLTLTAPTSLSFLVTGGAEDTSYSSPLKVTTSAARSFMVDFIVYVERFGAIPNQLLQDTRAFRDLVGSIDAGESVNAAAYFVVADPDVPNSNVNAGHVTWEIIDNHGSVISAGSAYEYIVQDTSFSRLIKASSVVNIPSNVPPTGPDTSYQLRWRLAIPEHTDEIQTEAIEVLGAQTFALGAADAVEMYGDTITLSFAAPKLYDKVSVELYADNTLLHTLSVSAAPARVSSGYLYTIALDSTLLGTADLVPYTVSWKYSSSNDPNHVYRETARLFLLNASLSMAIEDARARVSKARTTLLGTDDTLFDTPTIITWLRRGADDFNAHTLYTYFTMTNATGGIRSAWLNCAEVAMLRAQGLLEGEKAFDFTGQAISLNVDKTQHYNSLADALQAQIDSVVPGMKKNLAMRGVTGGDGNVTGAANSGRVGISLHQASPFPRRNYWSR